MPNSDRSVRGGVGEEVNSLQQYESRGFCSPIRIVSQEEAMHHLQRLNHAEERLGSLHYAPKVHTAFSSALELATHPSALEAVAAILGADILLYNVSYIIKEPSSKSFVSLHQDLTYWGFSSDRLVSMWLALTPATEESGCMYMLPGSHLAGQREHRCSHDEYNILYQSQVVREDMSSAVACPLAPGEASFHHGWTLHYSKANESPGRRVGLNVQYLAPSVRKLKGARGSAMLVKGVDRFGNFDPEMLARSDLDPAAILRLEELGRLHRETAAKPN